MSPQRGQRTNPLKISSGSLQSGQVGAQRSSVQSSTNATASNDSMAKTSKHVLLYIINEEVA
jgi:hypothetical protein